MASEDRIEAAAQAARAHLLAGEEVAAVLVAEPPALQRVYLCALRAAGDDDSPLGWVAFDEAGARIDDAHLVREAATVAALCETAEEASLAPQAAAVAASAGAALALVPAGENALRAALARVQAAARALDASSDGLRVARTGYVDLLGLQAGELAAALGDLRVAAVALSASLAGEPGDAREPLAGAIWSLIAQAAAAGRPDRFTDAVTGAAGAIDALVQDVLHGYRPPLRDQANGGGG